MNVAIIGAGGMGNAWAATLSRSPHVRLTSIIDPLIGTEQQPEWIDAYPQATRATALSEPDVDAVIITAHSLVHEELIEQALELGCHVLVEKPFATELAGAQRLVGLAERTNRTLMVSQNYRFFPGPQFLRTAIQEGRYGALHSVVARFWCDWPGKPYQHEMMHPMLLEMAIHHLDLARAICGANAVAGCMKEWNSPRSPYRMGGAVEALYTMKGDSSSFPFLYTGSLISTAPRTPWPGLWRFEFDAATLLVDSVDGNYGVFEATADGVEFLSPVEDDDSFGWDKTLHHFHECVTQGKEPWSSGRDNLQTLHMALGFCEGGATR